MDFPPDDTTPSDKCHKIKGKTSEIDIDDPSIQMFLKKSKKFDRIISSKMEIEFVRVLEDLIEVLIKKDVILISDFNNEVIKKLALRKSLRERLALINGDDLGMQG